MKTTREKRRTRLREQTTVFEHYMTICSQFYAELFDPAFDDYTYEEIYARYCRKWARIAAHLNEKMVTGKAVADMFQREFRPQV